MPPYYYAVAVLQGVCLIHMIRSRADQRWFYIVMFVPVLGPAIYFFSEVLPKLRSGKFPLQIPMLEHFNLRALEKQFRFSDTIENRVMLAEAYLEKGRNAEALDLYRGVLSGPFKNNLYLIFGYAKACYCNQAFDETLAVLQGGEDLDSSEKRRQRLLLKAMTLERLGKPEDAEAAYQEACKGFDGEEARCRYGLFLEKMGRSVDAKGQFDKIIEYAGISERFYRRREKAWIGLAKRELKAMREKKEAGSTYSR